MARTGRFGRLPTQAPDLSSQIVSLMEQWMNAEDRNILDAWTNGGKYKGKKVTDKDILAHYRKRRNGYDRDDPEWDEWNQDLWQVRYQIADEKVQMQYRMGKIGAGAVAAHYRKWARKMPKNSSYYRNLMATAGDFAKAAASGKSASQRGFDYQAMQDRINKLEREEQQYSDLFGALNKYAADRGFIQEGESLFDPDNLNIFEADDLGAILDGVREEMLTGKQFRDFREGAELEYEAWDGRRFTDAGLRNAVDRFVQIQREKIREWRKAPYDMSSYIKGARDAIRDARSYSRLIKQKGGYFDTASDLAEAWDIYTDGVQGAIDPEDVFSGDKNMRKALVQARNRYRRLGDSDTVAALDAVIKGFDAGDEDIADLLQLDPTVTTQIFGDFSPWAEGGEGAATWAQNRAALKRIIPLMKEGKAAIMYNEQPTDAELATGASALPPFSGVTLDKNASGRTVATNPVTGDEWVLGDKVQTVNTVGTNGLNTVIVIGREVYDADGNTVGYRYDVQGRTRWGRYDENGKLHYTTYAPWEQTSGTVIDDRGEQGIHVVTTGQAPEGEQAPVYEPIEVTLQRAIDNLEATQPDDVSEEEIRAKREGLQELQDQAIEGDFSGMDFNDPATIDAMEAAFPEILDYANGYGDPEAARVAIAKEYARQRFPGVDIEYDEAQAVYITPQGTMRTPADAEGYSKQVANGEVPSDIARDLDYRQTIIEKYPEDQPWVQTVAAEKKESVRYGGGFGQAFDIGPEGQRAYDIYNEADPTDVIEQPSDAIDEGAPGSVDTYSASNIYGTVENLNLSFVMDDPNTRGLTKQETDLFYITSTNSFSPGREEEQSSTFNQQLATVMTYGNMDPETALAIQSGASVNAITSGLDLGTGLTYAEFETQSAEAMERALPGWEVPLSQTVTGIAPDFEPKRPSIAVQSMNEPRLDTMLAVRPERVEEEKPAPRLKMAANLVDPVAQKHNIKQMAGPYGIPQPPGYRVTVQAPKAAAPPTLSAKEWRLEAKAAAASTPPPPPTIESAMKSLPK